MRHERGYKGIAPLIKIEDVIVAKIVFQLRKKMNF